MLSSSGRGNDSSPVIEVTIGDEDAEEEGLLHDYADRSNYGTTQKLYDEPITNEW